MSTHRLLIVSVMLLLIVSPTASAELAPDQTELFLDGLVPALMESLHVAGAALTIVQNDSPVIQKGYGWSSLDPPREADPETTRFRIGSVTKLFVWTAVMQLYESGRVDLDRDISAYIDFTVPRAFDQPITLYHLMTHTAGFEDKSLGSWERDIDQLAGYASWIKDHKPEQVRAPGTASSYSNYGAALAAYVVEQVSGMPFADYVQEHVFSPAGMEHTSLEPPPGEHLSAGFTFDGGRFAEQELVYLNLSPAGAAVSTAGDMGRFMLALSSGVLLEPGTAELMLSRAFIHDPRLRNGMTLGWYEQEEQGIRMVGHGGATLLFHSRLLLIPGHDIGIFVTCNSAGGDELGTRLVSALLERFFPPSDGGRGNSETDHYTGAYRLNRSSYTTVEKLFQLVTQLNVEESGDGGLLLKGGKGDELYLPVEEGVFRKYLDDQRIVFSDSGEQRLLFIESAPSLLFEPLRWYQQRSTVIAVVLFALSVHILWIGVLLRQLLLHRLRGRLLRLLAAVHSVNTLAFFSGTAAALMVFSDMEALLCGDPKGLELFLLAPRIITATGIAGLIGNAALWRRGSGSRGFRLVAGLMSLAAAGLIWFFLSWNLLVPGI